METGVLMVEADHDLRNSDRHAHPGEAAHEKREIQDSLCLVVTVDDRNS